ncbi:DUF6252 family protein [Flavobacterium soli]|uniref:DUF6252 family protein n=1 Tax=Flavobacterium soli TaxID=344881 RepID=UPI000416A0F6|nr:DUF6252 family protein [Flavobacterium soli]
MIKKITGLLAVILFTTFQSCSSDDSGENTTPSATISANIDGQAWQSLSGGAAASVTTVDMDGVSTMVLQIIAAKMDQSSVTLQFPISNLSTGTYTFEGDMPGSMSYIPSLSSFNMFSSAEDGGSFTVTLTEVNTAEGTISGTFSGTLVDFMGSQTIEVTNGVIENVSLESANLYSNGSMSLSKNGGGVFTINAGDDNGNALWILENSMDNSIAVTGYQTALNNDFGIYRIELPKDVEPGTYSLTDSGFDASYVGNDDNEYALTQGSITVVSHNGNTIVATFNYTASYNGTNVTITQGSLEFEHLD